MMIMLSGLRAVCRAVERSVGAVRVTNSPLSSWSLRAVWMSWDIIIEKDLTIEY